MKTFLYKLFHKVCAPHVRCYICRAPSFTKKSYIDPNVRVHKSYQDYLKYEVYKPKYLIELNVKRYLGGYLLVAHTGRKPIKKFFTSTNEIRSWLIENSYINTSISLRPEEYSISIMD